jgi:hypothetical protein
MAMMPRDPFPFFQHRTLAQVARTTDLVAAAAFRLLLPAELRELDPLLIKARRHNPPAVLPDPREA